MRRLHTRAGPLLRPGDVDVKCAGRRNHVGGAWRSSPCFQISEGAPACRDALAARALRRRMLLHWRLAAAAGRTLRLQGVLAAQHAERCSCRRTLGSWRCAAQLRVAARRLAECRAAALQGVVFKGWQHLTAACRCGLPLEELYITSAELCGMLSSPSNA